MRFEDLKISEPILKALKEKGYTEPTPIQAKAIPLILQKKDVLGCAQTGTGKTAAFAIPIIQLIDEIKSKNRGKHIIQSLIVTPTRELAIQIDENIKEYSKHTSITHTVIFGGVKQGAQVRKLNSGVDILVATPGRLLDLINQRIISISDVKLFVLDEADRMLDMGFIHDIKKLLQLLPLQRQNLFFSATMPDSIVKLANNILKNPIKVEVAAVSSSAETIQQYLYYTNRDKKRDLLLHILKAPEMDQVLVFTRTKHGADRIARYLHKNGIKADAIHGDKAQNQRQKALKKFKDGTIQVLVATDIAARGIDIDKLKFVINYEIPNISETYVHRIGRSGRAGEEGIAISLCEPEENAFVKGIEKLIGKKIDVINDNPFPQTDKPMTAAEKKEWEKEKQKRKQEFFANRKAKKEGRGGRSGGQGRGGQNRGKSSGKPERRNAKGPRSEDKRDRPAQGERSAKPQRSEQSTNRNGESKSAAKGAQNDESKRKSRPNDRPFIDKNKSGGKKYKGKKKSTNMPSSLKNKYMWPLEK